MADVCFGATVQTLVRFGLLPKEPAFADYIERLQARPAAQRAAAINERVIVQNGLGG